MHSGMEGKRSREKKKRREYEKKRTEKEQFGERMTEDGNEEKGIEG